MERKGSDAILDKINYFFKLSPMETSSMLWKVYLAKMFHKYVDFVPIMLSVEIDSAIDSAYIYLLLITCCVSHAWSMKRRHAIQKACHRVEHGYLYDTCTTRI